MANKAQVQYGSQGNDVLELQKLLNQNGFKLKEDGIFGTNTHLAVKRWQKQNGLSVDGIVGTNTWATLAGSNPTTTPSTSTSGSVSAPTAPKLPTAPTYDTSTWDDSTKGKESLGAYDTAKDAVANHGDFKYANQAQLDEIMNSILNREKFSYNFNEDAFYQQYKDKFIQQGKMAMQDTMGQAAAMTGGYGNSYASTVGSQAYQASLEKLNDVIPELYQMAYDRYAQEGQDLYNQYGLLLDDYKRAYGEHSDEYNKLMDTLGIARSDYYDGANMFYNDQNNKNSVAGQTFSDAMNLWQNENDNAWREKEFDYTQERNKIEDEQWQKQFDAVYGNKAKEETQNSVGIAIPFTPEQEEAYNKNNYDNGSLTTAQVKELQKAIGANVDGRYGPNSKKAAGGLSAEEAYKKYVSNGKKVADSTAVKNFRNSLSPESNHDTIARQMYGPYTAYVAVQLAKNTKLTDEEKMYLITYYGITESDLEYARDKGYDI
jgi:peptidoglycan hydrolase-like protein with peptidoglycan-binding domain